MGAFETPSQNTQNTQNTANIENAESSSAESTSVEPSDNEEFSEEDIADLSQVKIPVFGDYV